MAQSSLAWPVVLTSLAYLAWQGMTKPGLAQLYKCFEQLIAKGYLSAILAATHYGINLFIGKVTASNDFFKINQIAVCKTRNGLSNYDFVTSIGALL